MTFNMVNSQIMTHFVSLCGSPCLLSEPSMLQNKRKLKSIFFDFDFYELLS